MTLRRYAPLALGALALACQPSIDQRTNATTTEYAAFDPGGTMINPPNPTIATPNDIALDKFTAFLPGGAYAAYPCQAAAVGETNPTLAQQKIALCAYTRAGGFPAPSPVSIPFVRGTLADSGEITYAVSPDALDPATLAFGGASLTPTLGVIDLTAALPVVTATPAFAAGALSLTPSGGAWTAGHKYAVIVLGGDRGPKTLGAVTYTAMPGFYILRQSVILDLPLTDPANQGLFPGTDAEKAASGAALEPLRVAYRMFYDLAGASLTALNLPFADAISLQTFQIAPGGTIDIGPGTEPAPTTDTLTAGNTKELDAFTLQSTGGTATIAAVAVSLDDANTAVAALSVNAAPDCGTTTALGALTTSAGGTGTRVIPLSAYASALLSTPSTLYVCVTAGGATGTVTGTVSAVTAFPGTGYTSATSTDAASRTLNLN